MFLIFRYANIYLYFDFCKYFFQKYFTFFTTKPRRPNYRRGHLVRCATLSPEDVERWLYRFEVQPLETPPLVLLGVEIHLHGVVFLAGIVAFDGRHEVAAQRAPRLTQGAVDLAKVESHYLGVHTTHEVEVAPSEL